MKINAFLSRHIQDQYYRYRFAYYATYSSWHRDGVVNTSVNEFILNLNKLVDFHLI